MEEETAIIIGESKGFKKSLFEFVNTNFLGVSILVSTIIISGTMIFISGSDTVINSSAGIGLTAALPTTPTQQSGQDVGESASAPEVGDAPVLGSSDALVTIVEFSDYECPFCGRFFTDTLAQIKSEYVDTGKARFVYKDFPLSSIHPEAQKAAEAARCVREQLGDDGYWEMHDTMFENQQSLSIESFSQWARELGANGTQFDSCLSSDKYAAAVGEDLSQGTLLGVNGTPTIFINDVRVVGAVPYAQIAVVIENELGNAN